MPLSDHFSQRVRSHPRISSHTAPGGDPLVLAPAPADHTCPAGPPTPTDPGALQPSPGPPQRVTIIDSGYQWDPNWGQDPFNAYGQVAPAGAEWVATGGWAPGVPDRPDADNDGRLDALAGHANFIAGVIGQQCTNVRAQVTVMNHNGGFDPIWACF